MPYIETGELRVHYTLTGAAPSPVLVLSHSIGANLSLWEPQMTALEKEFYLLRYDTRGQGLTSATPGPYTIEELARDALCLLDGLRLDRVHFCGLSMGGMIGMWLGVHEPERLGKLALCSTAARIASAEFWNSRIETVREKGMKAIAPAAIERWFTPDFRAGAPETVAQAQRMLESSPPEGYLGCCAALRDADLRSALAAIRAPTLVIAGRDDLAVPLSGARFLAEQIAGAQYCEMAAAHLSNIEAPAQFTEVLIRFLRA